MQVACATSSGRRCGCVRTGWSSARCAAPRCVDLLAALNTGHEGGCGTVHANAAADVPARLEALGAWPAWSAALRMRSCSAGVQAVVHHVRRSGSRRYVDTVALLARDDRGAPAVVPASSASTDGMRRDRAWPALAALLQVEDIRSHSVARCRSPGRGGRAGVARRAVGAPRVATERGERASSAPAEAGPDAGVAPDGVTRVAGVAPSAAGGGRLGRPARPGGGRPAGGSGPVWLPAPRWGSRADATADTPRTAGHPGPPRRWRATLRGPQCQGLPIGPLWAQAASSLAVTEAGLRPRPSRSPRTSALRSPRPC